MLPIRAALVTFAALGLIAAGPPVPVKPDPDKIELTKMAGRWYEVARIPNKLQRNCEGATSDWRRTGDGYAVVQTCHKDAPDGPKTEWKAKAQVANPGENTRFKMSFFGGLVNQEYWVIDHRPDEGWLLLTTPTGQHLWLMSQRPSLAPSAKANALARVRQLGFNTGLLEFPKPARN
ncbi:MAG: lipocalin family protein [Phenylobacterium sp.]|uniref:lipocalin family protein n=1 Tax=Phenylobacterium sp. TaxID=1871053 RepID=UPI00391AD08C